MNTRRTSYLLSSGLKILGVYVLITGIVGIPAVVSHYQIAIENNYTSPIWMAIVPLFQNVLLIIFGVILISKNTSILPMDDGDSEIECSDYNLLLRGAIQMFGFILIIYALISLPESALSMTIYETMIPFGMDVVTVLIQIVLGGLLVFKASAIVALIQKF